MRYLAVSLFIFSFTLASGQGINDVIRYSLHQYNSTARSSGAAGAFGSLGADMSVASINPAGIAEFRKSEFAFGAGFAMASNTATLSGNPTEASENAFQFTHAGVVLHSQPRNFDVKTFNIAIGVNQLTSYNDFIEYNALNEGTRVERWLELANGLRLDELDNFEAGPAFDAEAILDNDDGVTYRSDFDNDLSARVQRSETIERSGNLNELYIAVASNRKNKFSWGLGLGIPFVSFSETKTYSETDANNNVEFFDALQWTESLDITGGGINIKGGVIVKITPTFRFGLSAQSPTLYMIQDNFNTSIRYDFTFDGTQSSRTGSSPNFTEPFEYQITTPWRARAGLSYIYKAGELLGFVSGDVEYVNYSAGSINLAANSNDPNDMFNSDIVNRQLDNEAQGVLNYNIGTELAYEVFRVRGGVALTTGPWVDESRLDQGLSFSGGLGYRGNKFYIDAAYTLRNADFNYVPYELSPAAEQFEQNVSVSSSNGFANLTLGFKF